MSEAGVYILTTMDGASYCKPVKIGYASDPKKRLGSLQSGNPRRLKLLFYFPLPYRELARLVEKSFHKTMKRRALLGEWYEIEPADAVRLLCSAVREHIEQLMLRVGGSDDQARDLLENSGVLYAEKHLGALAHDELLAAVHG